MTKPILTEDTYQFKVFPKDRIAVLGVQGSGKSKFLESLKSDLTLTVDNALIGKDPATGAQYLNELSEDERAVIAVLPSIAWAKRFANRIVGIHAGTVVYDSDVSSLDTTAFRKIYLVSNPSSATAPVNELPTPVAVKTKVIRKSQVKSQTKINPILVLSAGFVLGALAVLAAQRWLGIL